MQRAVGIVRVSQTRGREGDSFHSPTTQLDAINRACTANGWTLVACHEEIDVSGTKPLQKRPGLRQAVDAVESGRADLIVVAYFDRLVRSIKVQADVVERIEAAGGDIHTLDAGQITNGGATRKLTSGMLGLVAEYVANLTADKLRETQEAAVAAGIAPWKSVPAGFVKGADRRYVPDPVLAPVIVEAFLMRLRGESINTIRAYLAEHGVHRTYGGVREMLTLRAYIGEIRFGDLVNPAAHEPIVDRVLFERVQKVTVPRGRKPPSERLLARLGVLRCAHCGTRMTIGSNGNGTPAYRCNPNSECPGGHPQISAAMVEEMVVEKVERLLAAMQGTASSDNAVVAAKAVVDAAEAELKAVIGTLTAAGLLTDLTAAEKLKELREARDEAQVAFAVASEDDESTRVALDAGEWAEMTLAERRDLIKAVIESVDVERGRGAHRVTINAKVLR